MVSFDSVKKSFFGFVAGASTVVSGVLAREVIRTASVYKHHCIDNKNVYGVASFVTERKFFIQPILNAVSPSCSYQAFVLLGTGAIAVGLAGVAYTSYCCMKNRQVVAVAPASLPRAQPQATTDLRALLPSGWERGGPPPGYYH